ncbi:hypothetical protein [Marinoscillum furvescens]|uniref:Uncharacterized protein n=1 Tax=Marinoscillum furvescens DSM 4134 TaxID=1122208 RepID=A0A3D9LL64_MARFU|nr:hypothetical protein [Marinoscillum furvescens]REE06002.1 hypothetical protein C7460_101521 [Marinoscillum furvescens DSM 4134]
MKAFATLMKRTSLVVLGFGSLQVMGQEYDDLYFTKNDRKEVAHEASASNPSKETYQSFRNNNYSENYSTHEVNPEYIARYQSQGDYQSTNEYTGELDENANYSEPTLSNISYFPEDYQEENTGTTIINNYYQDSRFNNRGWNNNPRWGFNNSFWCDPWYSGWNISFGWGVGSVWYNDPWYNPYFRSTWWPNTFYGAMYPYGDPLYYGFGGFRGYRWNRFNYAYSAGFYDGMYFGGYNYYNRDRLADSRTITRGARYSRGGQVVSNNNRTTRTRATSASGTNVSNNSRGRKDYSRTQNEYFSRSRSSASTSNSRVATSSRSSNNRSGNTSYSRSRSSSSLSRNGTSSNSRRYSSSGVSRSTRSSGSSSYSRSSSSSKRTYSTPSRSSSSSYSSGRSRSSSFSSGSSSSRSSSSYSRSSSSSSRSSGSSSRSRSSSSSSRSRSGGR